MGCGGSKDVSTGQNRSASAGGGGQANASAPQAGGGKGGGAKPKPADGVAPPAKVDGEKFNQAYKLGKSLGEGAFSVVKEGTHKKAGSVFAIKVVTKSKLTEEDAVALKDEISILKELKHPNIIHLYEVYEEPQYYYLVTEIVRGGELFDRVVSKSYYNEKEARDVCKILLGALAYCHENSVAHRDLKPENLLLLSDRNDTDIKLADFGFAKKVSSDACLSTQCGTPGYVAPEILEGVKYGVKSDMWSIGVIVYILLGGYPPFIEENQRDLFRKIRKGQFEFHVEYWGQVSKGAKDLISALITVDPKKRLSAKEALQNSWITGSDASLEGKDLGKNLEAMKTFNAKRKFKAAVKGVVATQKIKSFGKVKKGQVARKLTDDEKADLKETFDMFDKDGGGTISLDELREVMKKMGQTLTERELLEVFNEVDADKNGEIDFDEFTIMMQSTAGDRGERQELVDAFAVFDEDGSGSTSKAEVKEIMEKFGQKLTEAELTQVMKEVDTDGDGQIDFEEFCQMMK
mmetsp:Transcript_29921/g.88966  ORF Transcript_29921/g.88966 Transcript_29921/m.88966 type:complete len:519 (-) Transcript_29921:688-2244(-)|eukprot:CAMPEP_0113591456 /NCGR_PEP_ID=MMETSP0015_2-20120614/37281_1 /TAXON_ID=2838 /ORGANISM="Odontella" /LENGTH=518 /DNA_ID=CAMNT_0000497843 /DNA_START=147 /DNA_END=1703 /DNA_ORIENTATION=- /assembly_acc=CAM_ASM_000160